MSRIFSLLLLPSYRCGTAEVLVFTLCQNTNTHLLLDNLNFLLLESTMTGCRFNFALYCTKLALQLLPLYLTSTLLMLNNYQTIPFKFWRLKRQQEPVAPAVREFKLRFVYHLIKKGCTTQTSCNKLVVTEYLHSLIARLTVLRS